MARRRKRWQKTITRLLVAAISDVRADLKKAHVQAVKGRVAAQEPAPTREHMVAASAKAMTSYDIVHKADPPGPKIKRLRDGYQFRETSNGWVREKWGDEPPWEPPASMTGAQKDARRRDHSDLQMVGLAAWSAMTPVQRQQAARNAGLCGAPCRDKTPCMNPKGCAIPSHRRNKK
jgi:hypothetical protein